jgi:hypothetical protein
VIHQFRAELNSLIQGDAAIWPSVFSGVVVAAISYFIGSSRGDIRVDVALASMATFLFGVLLAFTIARTRERLALVQDLLSKGNASLLSIHQLVEVFPEPQRSEVRDLIDRQLTDQIDYRLVDNHLSALSHQLLTASIYSLDPQDRQEEAIYKELVRIGIDMSADRALIESTTGQSLSAIEWTGLLLLLLLLIALIAVLPGGTALGALVAGVLAGTLVTLMILLRKLDQLRWHERVTIWEPTSRLFRSMGRDPYVPREVIDRGRYRPTGRVRIVDYPDPYPNRANKVVTAVDLDAPNDARRSSGEQSGTLAGTEL